MRTRLRDERGITAIIIGVFAMAIFGMVALVVDVGFLMIQRRVMVRGVDSAVLAAAQSYAVEEGGASPGANDAPAAAQANALATANQPDAVLPADEYRASFPCADADLLASLRYPDAVGCVTAAYHAVQSLLFAPVIGIDPQSEVGWRASAIWGPAGGATPAPIGLDATQFFPCYPDEETEVGARCAFWFDNNQSPASTWGWLNLNQWDVPPDAGCSSSGGDLGPWIRGENVPALVLRDPPPTYVCRNPGNPVVRWDSDLESQIGRIKIFPVSDPSLEIMGSHRKYAIIFFTALRIEQVLEGDDPAAFGSGGDCRHTTSLSPGTTIDIDLIASSNQGNPCPDGTTQDLGPPDAVVGAPTLSRGSTTYRDGVDYDYDADTRVVTWTSAPETNVRIDFRWDTAGICGLRAPDPNARCVVLSWPGPQVGGSLPGGGPPVPGALQAVRLAG